MGWKPPQKCSGVCHVGLSCVTYLISPLGIRQYISKNSVSRWWINCICFPRFSSLCWYKKGSWLLLWTSRPFNSDEWPRQKFSLLNQHNIKEARDENKEKYQLWDYLLIRYQILRTNITRTVWQTVRRITNEILGVKGLILLKNGVILLKKNCYVTHLRNGLLRSFRYKSIDHFSVVVFLTHFPPETTYQQITSFLSVILS